MASTDRSAPDQSSTEVPSARGFGLRARLFIMVLVATLPPTIVAWLVEPLRAGWSGLALIGAAMAFSFGLAFVLGASIVQSVEALIHDAQALSAGITGHRSQVRSSDEIGQLAVALNHMADTVERRNAALADNERRYRFLFDSNPLPMWAWDAETTNILAVNEAAIDKYGYDRETFLGLTILDLIDESERARFSQARLPFLEARQAAGTWTHRTASGERVEMDVITTSTRRLGRASWLSVGIDVSARREAERALARSEEQLRQSQKLEAIGTFAGGIAHDFNNLLTAMLGYCDLLLPQLAPESAIRRDIAEVRALAIRGTELSQQILSMSRRHVVQPTVFDPNEVVRGMQRLLRRVIGENIALESTLDEQVGTARADVSQLEQVLLNLAANARDAMPEGGRLSVDTLVLQPFDVRRLNLDPMQDWLCIRVRDTGIGMSEEVQAHIFEPFFTTKDEGKGSGLGLALAYSMIDQAGGEIRVDSAPGEGTTMYLLLPRLGDAVVSMPPVEEFPEQLAGTETVLLVEDEDTVRSVAAAALERRGYRVLVADHGEAAIAIAREYPGIIHLLVSDVVMPGLHGREVADRIVRLRPGIPVLFISGYTDDALLERGVLEGDDRSLLAKPFTSLELARRVRLAIDESLRLRTPVAAS
ncbi:MAG: response regulator [Gemmatimonadaceae bacterium]|nr:response regulator [Gemmatimonadaceae bacterium]